MCELVHNHIIKLLVVDANPNSFLSFSGKIR